MITRRIRLATVLASLCLALTLSGCGSAARQARYEKRGQDYLAKGQLEQARVEFANALQITPNSSRLRYQNGLVYEQLGKYPVAAKFFLDAVDADPENLAARAHLGNLYVLAREADKALEDVNPGLAKHPDAVELLTVRATALGQKNDRSGAMRDARRAVSLDPNSEDAITTLAGIEMAAGQSDDALALVLGAVNSQPKSIPLARVLLQVYVDRKDAAGVERELRALVRLQPGEKAFRLQLAQLFAKASRLDDAEQTLRAALADLPHDAQLKTSFLEFLWTRRGHEVAEAQLKRMIAATPEDHDLQLTLGQLYEQGNNAAAAEAQYRALIEEGRKKPYALTARDRLAALYIAKQDAAGAERLVREVLAENPGDNDALLLRARQESSRGQSAAVIEDLRRVLRDQPNSPEVSLALARAYVADGKLQLAEDSARRAVQVAPTSLDARMELARALIRTGKFEQGKAELVALSQQRPGDPAVLDLLFRASIALKDVNAAQLAAAELVKVQPEGGRGQLYQGILAEGAGRTEEALGDYRKALELQPLAVEPLQATVLLLQRQKRYDEAVALLDDFTARAPTSAVAPDLKGQVLISQGGHLPQAEAAFRLALQRAPKWWDPYTGLVSIAFARKDPAGASGVLTEAAEHADLTGQERLELAALFVAAEQPQAAMGQYEAVLKVDPSSQVAAGGLALLLVSVRTDNASISRANALVRSFAGSSDWRLLDAFGWVHFKGQDVSTALPALERANAQHPDTSQLRFHLGMAQLKAGQTHEAEKNLAQAIEPGTQFLGRDEAKAALAELRSRRAS